MGSKEPGFWEKGQVLVALVLTDPFTHIHTRTHARTHTHCTTTTITCNDAM